MGEPLRIAVKRYSRRMPLRDSKKRRRARSSRGIIGQASRRLLLEAGFRHHEEAYAVLHKNVGGSVKWITRQLLDIDPATSDLLLFRKDSASPKGCHEI
jgi:hypothetical protein